MTNKELQNRVLSLLESGRTVLAESERFVHQVQRQFRLRRIEEGNSAWDTPKVYTLNRWMECFWTERWPLELPASSFSLRLKHLKDCLDEVPPPEPLTADVELIRLLDDSFDLCLRYAMDTAGAENSGRLIEWRGQVWRSFEQKLSASRLFHPALLPAKIIKHIRGSNSTTNIAKMAFVGFEFAGVWEKLLLETLQERAGAIFCALPVGHAQPEHLVYSDPEQEVTDLMENLLKSIGEHAPHEIAVVLCASEFYNSAVSNRLQDILGEPVIGQKAAYNLLPDSKLSGQALYNAAVLPIRFALGGEKRNDMFSFLRSPYYGSFSPQNRGFSLWDRTWRAKGIESGIEVLLESIIGHQVSGIGNQTPETRHRISDTRHPGPSIRNAVAPFLDAGKIEVSRWTETLRSIWTNLEFPVQANEIDRLAWDSLIQLISEFETYLGETRLSAHEFFEILNAAAGQVTIQKSGFEDAGIQILGALDIRGLSFRKVFIPGLVSGSFPQSVRPLPLLTPSERRRVAGGTTESQFAFADRLYANFLAAAPQIILSRPAISKEGQISLPSPFWTKELETMIEPIIPWKHTLPAMQRARWVQQSTSEITVSKRLESGKDHREPESHPFRIQPPAIPNPISVSELQSLLHCPAQYFFRHILRLEALEEFVPGISPLERGQNIHTVLASFVSRALRTLKAPDFQTDAPADLLNMTVADVIGMRHSQTIWQVELERLIGKPGYPGLLEKWLDAECRRMLDGWSWKAVERPFEGMKLEGCEIRIKGRLDRIDSHHQLGLICWDYKTGRLPGRSEIVEENEQPQLPAYLLALSRGIVNGAPGTHGDCGAGFIELTSPGRAKHHVVFDPAQEHGPFLENWGKEVGSALNAISAGNISPLWLGEEGRFEKPCEYKGICGFVMKGF